MRLIDADKLIKDLFFLYDNNGFSKNKEARKTLTTISEQPTIYNNFDEVCEWKQDEYFDGMYMACSSYITYIKDFKFCPYCGKKIKVVR